MPAKTLDPPKLRVTAPTTSLSLQSLCQRYSVKRGLLPRLTGFSLRAVANWSRGHAPSAPALKKLTELKRLFEALARLVDPKDIGPWLLQPNPAFDGSTPLQVIERGESDRLWRMIYELESGQPD